MWWFIFTCVHLTRLRDTQIVVVHYFWVHLWRCFWKRLAFELVEWVKKMCPYQCGWALSNPLRAWKRQRKGEFSLSPLGLGWLSFSALKHQSSWFWSFWTFRLNTIGPSVVSDWVTQLALVVHQLSEGRSWDFSVSITTWANSYSL